MAEHRAQAATTEAALAAADEAVRIVERAPGSPARRLRLARARTTRSDILPVVDRPDAAVADAEAAAAALRQSARLTSAEQHGLVLALRSQARSLILLERYEEAVGVGRTALAQLGRLPWRLRVRLPQVRTGLRSPSWATGRCGTS